jgi:virginiamycin B lyase
VRRRSHLSALVIVLSIAFGASEASALSKRAVSVFPIRLVASGIVRGTDGGIWAAGGALVRIGITGDIHYVRIPGDAQAGITVGPDGALWYADTGQVPGVGRYLPGQQVTPLPVPGLRDPDAIAAGTDGALWVTDPQAHRLARVALDGGTRVLHTGRVAPGEIAVGADGALWISDVSGPRILRVDASGALRVFRLPGAGDVLAMTRGPDGAVWFTRPGGLAESAGPSRIGRITTDGHVQQFSRGLPPDAFPEGIVTGPDGNLWFTENATSAIGRITPDGRITNHFLYGHTPQSITTGADGALWFTDGDRERITRMPLSVCASRRVVRVHLRSHRSDPITSIVRDTPDVLYDVPGTGVVVPVTIDLRGYAPGPVRVILRARTVRGHAITYNRVFHPCGGAAS